MIVKAFVFSTFFLFNIFIASAFEIVINAINLEKSNPVFIGEAGEISMIPESGIVKVNVSNLPTIIRVITIEKRKVITHKMIWLTGNNLLLEGSIDKNTIDVSPKEMGISLADDIENEWLKVDISKSPAYVSSQPFLVYIATNLQNQKTEDLKNLVGRIPENERGFWATAKIIRYLNDLESIGFDPSSNTFEYLTAINKNGEKERFERPKDKFLLIDFSWSGCRPCLEDIDELVKLQEDFINELEILSIWNDKKQETWLNMAKKQKDKITWTSLRDGNQAVFTTFGIDTFPTYLLIDPNGQTIKKWQGSGIGKVRKYLK